MGENEKQEFVQLRTPDRMRVIYLINQAKGPNRTMGKFAEDCGLSPATMSRAVNKSSTKPLTEDVMRAIVENADPEGKVELESLAFANGMVKPDAHGRRIPPLGIDERMDRMNIENIISNTLTSEVVKRGYQPLIVPRVSVIERTKTKFGIPRMGTFNFRINHKNYDVWNIYMVYEYRSGVRDDEPEEIRRRNNFRFTYRRLMERLSPVFLSDSWEPEIFERVKTSILFTDKELMEYFWNYLGQATVNSYMTFILFDVETQTVVEERQMTWKNAPVDGIFDEEYKPSEYYLDDIDWLNELENYE